jgi:hypothetical protein
MLGPKCNLVATVQFARTQELSSPFASAWVNPCRAITLKFARSTPRLFEYPRAGHVERMINETFGSLDELIGRR